MAMTLLELLKCCGVEPTQRLLQQVDGVSSTFIEVRPLIPGWDLQGLLLLVCNEGEDQLKPGIL